VVIWFSDDPSLNEQTRFRLMESSDRLRDTDMVVVENTFNRPSSTRKDLFPQHAEAGQKACWCVASMVLMKLTARFRK
jgi:hypothetical protein